METYGTLKRDDSFEKFSMDCLKIQEYQQNRYPYVHHVVGIYGEYRDV